MYWMALEVDSDVHILRRSSIQSVQLAHTIAWMALIAAAPNLSAIVTMDARRTGPQLSTACVLICSRAWQNAAMSAPGLARTSAFRLLTDTTSEQHNQIKSRWNEEG